MEILLSEGRERFVRSLVEWGAYASEGAVVEAALQLLQDCGADADLGELRREIAAGIEEADRGELGPFDPASTLARVRSGRG